MLQCNILLGNSIYGDATYDAPLKTMHTSLQQWHFPMAVIVSPDGHSQMSCGHASTDQSPIQGRVSMDQICSAPKDAQFGEFGNVLGQNTVGGWCCQVAFT